MEESSFYQNFERKKKHEIKNNEIEHTVAILFKKLKKHFSEALEIKFH